MCYDLFLGIGARDNCFVSSTSLTLKGCNHFLFKPCFPVPPSRFYSETLFSNGILEVVVSFSSSFSSC